jgi:hypothetical protein
MIVPEQVKRPLLSTAAAHGADETVLPPMMFVVGSVGAAVAAAGTASTPVRAVAREATTMRMRTPGSFRGRSTRRTAQGGSAVRGHASNLIDRPYARGPPRTRLQFTPISM